MLWQQLIAVLAILAAQTKDLKKLVVSLFFFFCLCFQSSAQTDSCALRISLLTCAPGEELYSTFGHTALRVKDVYRGTDHVFNYGTFEFGPDFYTQFIQGKLLYFLSVENFEDFLYQYQMESRSVIEQTLNLSCEEKEKLLAALQTNAQEANRYYRYDFLFDNCTTRAKDITKNNSGPALAFKNILPQKLPTFRNLIHSYLDAGRQPWSKLGIDILLGVKLDRQVTNEQAMFLPDYLLKGFDSASIAGRPLVENKQTILQLPSPVKGNSLFTPLLVFSLLLVIVVACSFLKSKWASRVVKAFDLVFFFLLGLAGLLLLFMWFGTNHTVCRNNYNLLWALPTHVIMALFVYSNRSWVKVYFGFVFWFSLVLAAAWLFLPQQMNSGLFPILLLIVFRSWHLSKKKVYAGV